MRRLSFCFAFVLFMACTVGHQATNFRVAQQPPGAEARVVLDRSEVRGELLAVEDSALIILRDRQVTRVPYTRIRQATFGQTRLSIRDYAVSNADRNQLRLISRFPQGLNPKLLHALLSAYGQSEIATPAPR